MKDAQATPAIEITTKSPVLFMAMELSAKTWKLCFGDGSTRRRHVSVATDVYWKLADEVKKAKVRFGLPPTARVLSCHEAGRDGFWIHRFLGSLGIGNSVVDSSSIEVPRRKRKRKTDRLDAEKLLRMLIRYHQGDKRIWSVVRVPSREAEDGRRLHRELERLKKERTAHTNRIRSLLVTQGLTIKLNRRFLSELDSLRQWDDSPLDAHLKAELVRQYQRLTMVNDQIRRIEKQRDEMLKSCSTPAIRQVSGLMSLRGIGKVSAWTLVHEFFAWRDFANRRQVGSAAGLTGTPYNSGGSETDQGISKAGNRRIRHLMVEIAWRWLQFQPGSALSRWFNWRFASGGKRMRRVGIVALARKLLVALWKYVEFGEVPNDARLMKI